MVSSSPVFFGCYLYSNHQIHKLHHSMSKNKNNKLLYHRWFWIRSFQSHHLKLKLFKKPYLNTYHLVGWELAVLKNFQNKVSKSLSFQADHNRSCHMGILVGIFPRNSIRKRLSQFKKTWQGHSECSILKADTQAVSQLVSSLQSKIHWPRVLLVLFKQASKLSSLESSWSTINYHSWIILTYVAEADRIVASLTSINAISMTRARLKCYKHNLNKNVWKVLTVTTNKSSAITFHKTLRWATGWYTLQELILALRDAHQTQVIVTEKKMKFHFTRFWAYLRAIGINKLWWRWLHKVQKCPKDRYQPHSLLWNVMKSYISGVK